MISVVNRHWLEDIAMTYQLPDTCKMKRLRLFILWGSSIKHSETQARKQTHYKRTHWTVEKNSKYWTCRVTYIWTFFHWFYQIRTRQGYRLAERGETQHNRNDAQSLHCDSESSLSLRTFLYRSQTNYCLHQKPTPLWQVTMANELEDNLGWEPLFCRLYVYLLNKLACNHWQKNKRRGAGAGGGGLGSLGGFAYER